MDHVKRAVASLFLLCGSHFLIISLLVTGYAMRMQILSIREMNLCEHVTCGCVLCTPKILMFLICLIELYAQHIFTRNTQQSNKIRLVCMHANAL